MIANSLVQTTSPGTRRVEDRRILGPVEVRSNRDDWIHMTASGIALAGAGRLTRACVGSCTVAGTLTFYNATTAAVGSEILAVQIPVFFGLTDPMVFDITVSNGVYVAFTGGLVADVLVVL